MPNRPATESRRRGRSRFASEVRSRCRAVALLVFLARPARTRVVAADLRFLALDRLRLLLTAGEEHRLLLRLRGRALRARGLLLLFALDDDLHPPEVFDDAVLD